MASKIQRVTVKRTGPTKGRIVWTNNQNIQAILLLSAGISPQVVRDRTGLSLGQISYRGRRCGVRCTDYRFMRSNSLGGKVAGKVLRELDLRASVQNLLPG